MFSKAGEEEGKEQGEGRGLGKAAGVAAGQGLKAFSPSPAATTSSTWAELPQSQLLLPGRPLHRCAETSNTMKWAVWFW
jgi:hypothetical protein